MQKTLIIGGKGYIGSKLIEDLSHFYELECIDSCLFNSNFINIKNYNIDYNLVDEKFLEKYNNIILLAGHSSVRMCDAPSYCVFNNNVRNFVSLIAKLNSNHTLLYASSASVYGDCKINEVTEDYKFDKPYNMYDLSKQMIDVYSNLSKAKCRIFGLRFGTVNGYSPVLRNDVMINAMVHNIWTNNKILLFNPDVKRSILGINDLVYAIKAILDSKNSGDIYNLCSFTKTAKEIAVELSKIFNCEIDTILHEKSININEKLLTNKYNFSMSCKKFITDFNFSFRENINTIVDGLINNKNNMIFTDRNQPYIYTN